MSKRYVSAWSEDDALEGRRVKAFVVILRTSGCSWYRSSGGCSMCGYNEESEPTSGEDLIAQFSKALERYDGEEVIKIYTSGSFLDHAEVPMAARDRILSESRDRAERIVFESRPEFVENIDDDASGLEIAIGLETADDGLRENCIGKGFTFEDFRSATSQAREKGAAVRTYLLLKPPGLTERSALDDAISSITAAAPVSDVISINPMNIQRRTKVEKLWQKGRYSPPWLWSLLEALRANEDVKVVSHPSGGGKARGVHNCGECDDAVLGAIRRFSLDGDAGHLDLSCGCMDLWRAQMDLEDLALAEGIDYRKDPRMGTIPLG